ncbi:hypothetical protein A2U01_0099692, partial [Trifolium medium]|nr:hypothetical protein [Trifolium medium]
YSEVPLKVFRGSEALELQRFRSCIASEGSQRF